MADVMHELGFLFLIFFFYFYKSISNEKCYIKEPNGENGFLNSVNIAFLIICIPMVKSYLEKSIIF
jgi:hypothetical protein